MDRFFGLLEDDFRPDIHNLNKEQILSISFDRKALQNLLIIISSKRLLIILKIIIY